MTHEGLKIDGNHVCTLVHDATIPEGTQVLRSELLTALKLTEPQMTCNGWQDHIVPVRGRSEPPSATTPMAYISTMIEETQLTKTVRPGPRPLLDIHM